MLSILTIFRGLPGSGKSTMASSLAKKTGAMVIEPDALLVVDGVYAYSERRYREAVKACELILRYAGMGWMGADVIYADVLPTVADVDRVIKSYRFEGDERFIVKVISLATTADDAILTNRHNVAEEDIRRMERDWEAYPGELVM